MSDNISRRRVLALFGSTIGSAAILPRLARSAPQVLAGTARAQAAQGGPLQFSGIYPHLAYFNTHGECGTGAVVPWAGRLWVISYAPHQPNGSSDKLYEIDQALHITARPESVGGTPANRMIHRESGRLFIGPYAIDAGRKVPLQASVPSDAYLMTGYDRKTLSLSHAAPGAVTMRLEVDVSGTGQWVSYRSFTVAPATTVRHVFPAAFQAYWVRAVADQDCRATAQLLYD